MGMVQGLDRLGFLFEPGDIIRGSVKFLGEELESYDAVQFEVFCLIDDSHAAGQSRLTFSRFVAIL
jgi:hypothetical protein